MVAAGGGDGFTEGQLEEALVRWAAASTPPIDVRRSLNDAFELVVSRTVLATLCPAGPEPFDYLLVDFADTAPGQVNEAVRVAANAAEQLALTVLELDSRLEYSPQEWAIVRSRYHSPDPSRRSEAHHLELDREIMFFERRGLPYSPEEISLLRAAASAPEDRSLQSSAQDLRDRKKREDRPAVPIRGRRYTDRPGNRSWWSFAKRR